MGRCLKLVLGAVLLCGATAMAEPADVEELQKTIAELNATLKAQQAQIDQLECKMDEGMQAEMAKVARELADDAAKQSALPTWLDNLKFYGDMRLRYQNDCFAEREKKRNRARFRLRFGFTKTWLDDQMEVGFRLASGSDCDPTSTNQTFTDHFNRKTILIDRVYAKWEPKSVPGLTVMGGKFGTPMVHTDLIWDSDVNPEGVWAQYRHKCGDFSPFVNAGYFILDSDYISPAGAMIDRDNDGTADFTYRDVILVTYQVGMDWKITEDVKWTIAATYYDFDHLDVSYRAANGNNTFTVNTLDGLDAYSFDRLAARQFHMINLTNKVDWKLFDLPWAAYFDWVHNCGDEDTAFGYTDQRDGFAVGAQVGQNKKKGDWSVAYKYAYIEANCTPGALNDSDFGHSNRKGHVLAGKYNLADSLTVRAGVYLTEPVTGLYEDDLDVATQVDLVWKF